jgi:2-succinyl-5-enolpyruvyl-6-hydroxy-3-cyclohexene-1-carboxylate synthase
VSTAIGIAQAGNSVKLLLGDLTLIHELSGLNLTGLDNLNLQVIIGNDGGGHIFDRLEMREHVSDKWFETLFTTPQNLDLEKIVTGFGWAYRSCENLEELEVAMQLSGPVVIDYRL